jgi:hypothetical protein
LKQEQDNLQLAVVCVEANQKRRAVRELELSDVMAGESPRAALVAQADLDELRAIGAQETRSYDVARKDLQFITELLARIEPFRRFSHLPDDEAFQACQSEEWRLKLIHRAENYLVSGGSIPAAELNTMRAHPAFVSSIGPAIASITHNLRSGPEYQLSGAPNFVPALLTKAEEA